MLAGGVTDFLPPAWVSLQSLTLLAALVMTGLICILMGCGIPTTANYIIMVSVAAPTLVQLGVEPLVAHFFVFYYGVLADITPPVALAAYASAGMAGSDPFKTGNTAFRLGLGKVLVPFVFVFSPSLLLVSKGVAVEKIRVDLDTEKRGEMMQLTGRRTVPQIFVGETHVGGYDDLAALDQAGKLDELLRS